MSSSILVSSPAAFSFTLLSRCFRMSESILSRIANFAASGKSLLNQHQSSRLQLVFRVEPVGTVKCCGGTREKQSHEILRQRVESDCETQNIGGNGVEGVMHRPTSVTIGEGYINCKCGSEKTGSRYED